MLRFEQVFERTDVEIKIGIKHTQRELEIDVDGGEELTAELETKIRTKEVIHLSDKRGSRYVILGENVAYLQIKGESPRKVGFSI